MSFQNEKRQHPRTKVAFPVIIETSHGFTDGQIVDISAGGAFLLCRNSFKLTNKIYMAIANVPQLSRHLPVGAELIRTNTFGSDDHFICKGVGVRFIRISTEDRKYISALVSGHIMY
jgi:Tfp pilus assembly protein PilZ